MGGVRNRIGEFLQELVLPTKLHQSFPDLFVALGPFHENDLSTGKQARSDARQSFGDGFQSPRDGPLDAHTKRGINLVIIDRNPFESQSFYHFPKELHPFVPSLGEDDFHVRASDLQRNAGKSRARAYIKKRRGKVPVQELGCQDAVDVVLLHHVVKLVDAGKVIRLVFLPKESMKFPKLLVLILIQS